MDADPCPADLRARWVLAWMGVLLGAACLLLLLLLKQKDVKGERCPCGGCAWPGIPPRDPTSPSPLPAGWLKSLRADHGSEGERGASLGSGEGRQGCPYLPRRGQGTEQGGSPIRAGPCLLPTAAAP